MVRAVVPGQHPAPSDDDDLPSDGRSARAVRTRRSIADALLELLEEGDLQPTATRIADRAGISLRLIYHHFGDLESLFGAAARRQSERMAAAAVPIDVALPLDERVQALVRQRAALLEWITPVRRAALLQEPFSDELRDARNELVDLGARQVTDTFARELDDLGAGERATLSAALATTLSWGYWNDLRETGQSVARAEAVVLLTVRALLGASPGS